MRVRNLYWKALTKEMGTRGKKNNIDCTIKARIMKTAPKSVKEWEWKGGREKLWKTRQTARPELLVVQMEDSISMLSLRRRRFQQDQDTLGLSGGREKWEFWGWCGAVPSQAAPGGGVGWDGISWWSAQRDSSSPERLLRPFNYFSGVLTYVFTIQVSRVLW